MEYAAEDADITWRLYEVLEVLLEEKKLRSLFDTLEMPLVRILAEMEYRGILLDEVEMELYSRELEDSIDLLRKEIYTLCGKKFNINSTKQLQEILFTDRKLQPIKKNKNRLLYGYFCSAAAGPGGSRTGKDTGLPGPWQS